MGWTKHIYLDLTLKELLVAYDAKVVHDWDHTSLLASLIYNLQCVVTGIMSKSKPKPKSPIDLHPFRQREKKSGLKIGPKNIAMLKLVGDTIRGKR